MKRTLLFLFAFICIFTLLSCTPDKTDLSTDNSFCDIAIADVSNKKEDYNLHYDSTVVMVSVRFNRAPDKNGFPVMRKNIQLATSVNDTLYSSPGYIREYYPNLSTIDSKYTHSIESGKEKVSAFDVVDFLLYLPQIYEETPITVNLYINGEVVTTKKLNVIPPNS